MKRIRVCFISDNHSPFDDRIYWKEAISLLKKDYVVSHICVGETDKVFYSSEGIEIHQIAKVKCTSSSFINKLLKPFLLSKLYKKIYQAAATKHANVYHFHDLRLLRIAGMIKRLSWKPKLVHCIRESYPDMIRDYNKEKGVRSHIYNLYANYISGWEKRKTSIPDHIVTIDDAMYERFSRIHGKEKLSLLYNYTNIFPEIHSVQKKYDLIYTGSINQVRGIIQLTEAISIVKKDISDIKLLIIGIIHDPHFKTRLFKVFKKLDLQENIIYKEPVPHPEVTLYLSASKIGIVTLLPIPKFHKNIPIKQFEYMAFGLPVIGSSLPPIEDFIRPVNAGIIVDPLNPQEIADAIIRLLKDNKLYLQLSKNASVAAREKYNWKFEEEKLWDIYKNITKSQ